MNQTFVLWVFSPESEYGWVLWTRGSVLSAAPSLRGQSPHCPHLRPPLVTHLSELAGPPSAGSATWCWVWWISPNPQRRQSTGLKGKMASIQYSRDTLRKSKTWWTTIKASTVGQKEDRETDEFGCYLSPNKLSQPKENTPQPLCHVQRLTAEWLPSKLHNYNLHKAKKQDMKLD